MNKQAADFCRQILEEIDRTEDRDEKIILLNVLSERVNQWTLAMRLQIIQRKSKERV